MAKREPDELEGFTVWKCGRCERTFATADVDATESCPYCGATFMAGTYSDYNVTKQ
jgi:rubrerythrin